MPTCSLWTGANSGLIFLIAMRGKVRLHHVFINSGLYKNRGNYATGECGRRKMARIVLPGPFLVSPQVHQAIVFLFPRSMFFLSLGRGPLLFSLNAFFLCRAIFLLVFT
ncbi:MAG: hypothetical protein D3908_11290 [Candidatus Electrothrix sp. AUS4]|nr:hypothetical protein [Candidatus Electrothrix sp. AUS4]